MDAAKILGVKKEISSIVTAKVAWLRKELEPYRQVFEGKKLAVLRGLPQREMPYEMPCLIVSLLVNLGFRLVYMDLDYGHLYTFFQMAQDESLLKGACCVLHERDVIFGSEKKLEKTLETVKEHYQPEVIAILGCCVPALIGDDIEAVRNAEELPIVYIDAAGFRGWEWEGYGEALLSLLPFIKKRERKRKNINILGLDSFAPKARADAG